MTRLGSIIMAAALLVLGAAPLRALNPLPEIYQGPGYLSWQVQEDARLWQMETLLERLRDPNMAEREKAMKEIGIEKFRAGRSLVMPEIIQPMHADLKWLGIERRKHAILSLPIKGKHLWLLVLFRQDSNDEAYWRPYQVLRFDTDPVEGLTLSYPDILGDQIYFLGVKHLVKDDMYGVRKVQSFFKYDENRVRLTYQETDNYYRAGQFQGDPQRLKVELTMKGDQRILRHIEVKTYPFMPGPEFFNYEESNVKPRKVETASESFSFNPQNFSFYDPEAELEKLVTNPSAYVRREAARRLGERLKTTHPQIEHAMLSDKDAYVRVQCALALENIGDTAALPSLKKALDKFHEPDTMEEAYRRAFDTLSKLKAEKADKKEKAPEKAAKPKKAKPTPTDNAAMPKAEGPKLNDKKK
jgi:hypothetical protein